MKIKTGSKLGKWTVIKESNDKKNRKRWFCKCECGTEKIVEESSLTSGASKSCGCRRHDKAIDVTGQKFGRWTAIKKSHVKDGQTLWLCKCECGNESTVYLVSLRDGTSKSCGCMRDEVASKFHKRHGACETKEYKAWNSIKARCYNVNNKAYPNYGGRGVKMCDRWLKSFEIFFADVGLAPSPKHSIDRHPNNDGDYEPGNCRWATRKEQQNNRRTNVYITYNGETKTLTEWAEKLGESVKYFQHMFTKKGMSIEQIVNRKKRKRKRSVTASANTKTSDHQS